MTEAPTYALLPSRALISLSGPDWRDFLQGLITQDVETLGVGEARFGALLTPQGRLLYDLFIVGREDGCWLDVLAEHRAAIVQRLTMYRLRAKVEIAADETPVSVLFGGAAGAEPGPGWVRDPRLPALAGGATALQSPRAPALQTKTPGMPQNFCSASPGPADWGSDKTYPIEANFDLLNGIDFKKGCFVGQETTSRMKRRGQIKSRMMPIAFEGSAPAPGAEVLAGDLRAGEVLSVGDGRAMALLRLDRAEGKSLTVDGRPVTVERPAWILDALGVETA